MGSPLHPDFERVHAARQRDTAALAWLTERLKLVPRLVSHLARRAGAWSTTDLADAAQEVVQVALRRLDSYHGLASFEAWLHRICVLTLRGQARRRRRQGSLPLDFDLADDSPGPGEQAADREQREALQRSLDAIGGVEAEVLRQRYQLGLDFADIAAREGIPLATIRTRYYRALKKLQQRIAHLDSRQTGES